jgi:hypothetical protein
MPHALLQTHNRPCDLLPEPPASTGSPPNNEMWGDTLPYTILVILTQSVKKNIYTDFIIILAFLPDVAYDKIMY